LEFFHLANIPKQKVQLASTSDTYDFCPPLRETQIYKRFSIGIENIPISMMLHNSNGVNHGSQLFSTSGRAVSKKELCPLCEKPDWCFLLNEGNAVICGRTDIAPSGWIWRASAKDGRAIFAKEGIDNNTQHSRENFYSAHRRVSDLPIPDSVKLILQIKEDFPVWVDLTSHIDAVERQIIYPYPDPSTGNPLGRVVRRQWSDRRPVYQNREKSIRPEYCVDSCSREEDKWVTGKGKKPWPLYREAEVQEAIARGESTIFYGAGEQAVESFRKLGLTAFCNQGGEGTAIEQIKDFLKTCKPPLLVVWADHDKQGKETKVKLLEASKAAGIRAVAIDPLQIWLEMPVKGDITNVLGDSGMEPPEIIRRLEAEIYRALNRREQTTVGLGQERQKLPAASAIAAELAERY